MIRIVVSHENVETIKQINNNYFVALMPVWGRKLQRGQVTLVTSCCRLKVCRYLGSGGVITVVSDPGEESRRHLS